MSNKRLATAALAALLMVLGGLLHSPAARAQDGAVAFDAITLTDAMPADSPGTVGCNAAVIGTHCTQNGGECGANATCLLTSSTLGGVCTCPCTPDNPNTPLINEDSCPGYPADICGRVELADGSLQNFCFQTCQPKLGSNDCMAPLACNPRAASIAGYLQQTVCLFFGCSGDADCPVTTGASCDTAQPNPCAAGEACLPLTDDTTIGVCAAPGNCDTASGLCGGKPVGLYDATAQVGDPCASDKECNQFQRCEEELDAKVTLGAKDHGAACTPGQDECCGGCNSTTNQCEGSCAVHARNGYCITSGCAFATPSAFGEFQCPAGSTCNRLFFGGLCMKSCTLQNAASCRGVAQDQAGDYECRAWTELTIGQTPLADTPVCDFGDVARCSFFAGSKLTCAALGVPLTNATDMRCRALDGTPLVDAYDPTGFCLDNTSSGPAPATDAGVGNPDATSGHADAGPLPSDAAATHFDLGFNRSDVATGPLDMGPGQSDGARWDFGTFDAVVAADGSPHGGPGASSDGGGCACALHSAQPPPALWLLLLAAAALRRRFRG